jgi:hypothetical protein
MITTSSTAGSRLNRFTLTAADRVERSSLRDAALLPTTGPDANAIAKHFGFSRVTLKTTQLCDAGAQHLTTEQTITLEDGFYKISS